MADKFGLVRKSMRPKLGRRSFFTPEGKVALMFLKMNTGLSCPKLMEQLNGNIHYQIFCDVIIDPIRPLMNYKLLDDIMMELVRVRATAMEGSFGTQKEHYDLRRVKEVKSIEFGAKVNNILVDGISFIEKLSFNAFNEGTRMVHCLKMHKRLFGVEAKKVGGDTGYAGTENWDYCKANGIQTSFVKRGRPFGEKKKEKDLVRKELARARATAMEGSFGTQKEHNDLRRVKARTKRTEILYIFFGIHTANVVQLADRIEQRARLASA